VDRAVHAVLNVDVEVTGDEVTVTLVGELDLSNVDTLKARLEPFLQLRPRLLIFDLSNLRFLDSSGIGLLLSATSQVGSVRLRQPSEIVRQVVTYTGLSGVLLMDP
jgi:anti-anti-sigma factor